MGDFERAKENSKYQLISKLDKLEKLDKLDKCDETDDAYILKLRAGLGTMVLDSKLLLDDEVNS